MRRGICRFIYVASPHKSEVLSEAVVNCSLGWNIDRKLSTITFADCLANDGPMDIIMEKLPFVGLSLAQW